MKPLDLEKTVQKKDIFTKLKKMGQSEFIEIYYSPFAVGESSSMDPENSSSRENEDLKDILMNVNRRRAEIKRFTDMFNSGSYSDSEKQAYVEQVRKNTKVMLHLKNKAVALMEKKGLRDEELREYLDGYSLDGRSLKSFDSDASEAEVATCDQNYAFKLKNGTLKPRALLEIDQIEARALLNRTACSSISELCDMMFQFISEDGSETRFLTILESALVTKKKTNVVNENLKAISEFEARLHFESYDKVFQIEKNKQTKKATPVETQIDLSSQELAYSYLPYWDAKLLGEGDSRPEESKQAKGWFNLSPAEAYNMCRKSSCYTYRDFILFYRTNQALYTPAEIRELVKKGIDELRITQFTKLIGFLSAQWLNFPSEISSIISLHPIKIKLDLSRVELESPQSLQALLVAFQNSRNVMKRLDISGTCIGSDISLVINELIFKQAKDRSEKAEQQLHLAEDQKENLDMYDIEEMNLSGNFFSQKGIDQLMNYGQRVRCYGFDKCGLDKNSFTRLSRLIASAKKLRVLSIEFNNIGNQGMQALLDSLKRSPTLLYLNISENALTHEVLPSLVSLIQENTLLEALECDRNV